MIYNVVSAAIMTYQRKESKLGLMSKVVAVQGNYVRLCAFEGPMIAASVQFEAVIQL